MSWKQRRQKLNHGSDTRRIYTETKVVDKTLQTLAHFKDSPIAYPKMDYAAEV